MKKHFNIKKISLIVFAFICIFFTIKNVEAKDKYLCRYDISSLEFACAKSNCRKPSEFYFSFEYDGNYKTNLYDYKNKKNATNDLTFAINNSFFLDETTTKENLNSWKFNDKKDCPKEIWVSWKDNMSAEAYFGSYVELSTGIAFFLNEPNVSTVGENIDKCTSQTVKGLYGYYPCKKISLDATYTEKTTNSGNGNGSNNGNGNGNNNGNSTPNSANTCIYTWSNDESHGDAIELVFNNGITSAKHVDSDSGQALSTANIKETLTECPQVLYEIANEANVGNDLYIERPSGDNVGIYYLKKKFSVEEGTSADDSDYDTCESLGETKKYFVIFFNLIRFVVPIAIIIFSVIDFVGVTLSGETEKMEKAKKRFITRLIVGIAILFIPAIIELILRISGIIEGNENLIKVVCEIF